MNSFREMRSISIVWFIEWIWEIGRRLVAQNNVGLLARQSGVSVAELMSGIQLELYFYITLGVLSVIAVALIFRRQFVGLLLGCLVSIGYLLPPILILINALPVSTADFVGLVVNAVILVMFVSWLARGRRVQTGT